MPLLSLVITAVMVSADRSNRRNEFIIDPSIPRNSYVSPPVYETFKGPLPQIYDWGDLDGRSFLTAARNQHVPQYCGSCWAHGAVSALQDRIKIARDGKGLDVTISIQQILNCHGGGTCNGGDHVGAFYYMQKNEIAFEDANPYLACSADYDQGLCSGQDWSCSPMNIARTCGDFGHGYDSCVGLTRFPNVTVSEYGMIPNDARKIQVELVTRGPVACGVNADPLLGYSGGIFDEEESDQVDHIVSTVGYGEEAGKPFWRVRNSWGTYWGEMGFFRILRGVNKLGIEGWCAWATASHYSETNFPCHEDGSNCAAGSPQPPASNAQHRGGDPDSRETALLA